MLYAQALDFIIDDGIEGARESYSHPRDTMKLEGAIQGFSECRGRQPPEIAELLHDAQRKMLDAYLHEAEQYWFWRCREAEIEWVANVMSCILDAQGLPPITTMTYRGMTRAAEIIGVGKST